MAKQVGTTLSQSETRKENGFFVTESGVNFQKKENKLQIQKNENFQEERELSFGRKKTQEDFEKEKNILFPKHLWIKNGKLFFPKEKKFYSKKELAFFEEYLLFNKEKIEFDIFLMKKHRKNNGTDDTHRPFKSFDGTTEDMILEISLKRLVEGEKHLEDLKRALFRIKSQSFGFCKTTGKIIHPWRLFVQIVATERIEVKKTRKN